MDSLVATLAEREPLDKSSEVYMEGKDVIKVGLFLITLTS